MTRHAPPCGVDGAPSSVGRGLRGDAQPRGDGGAAPAPVVGLVQGPTLLARAKGVSAWRAKVAPEERRESR